MTDRTAVAASLRVGAPDVAGPLAVFPVFGLAPTLEYRSFAEACALGAAIRELPAPSVNDVLVDNPLDVAVLLYEGEEVQGAQQDRTLDVSVLIAARSRLQVPVSCVEAGRWDSDGQCEELRPAPQSAFPELRRAKSRAARLSAVGRAEQQEVWQLVDDKAERHDAASATGAMHDVFEARRGDLDEVRASIRRHDEQIGAVATIAGQIVVADVVGRADVFAALHAPLVSGYALDAVEHLSAEHVAAPEPGAIAGFLHAALAAATAPSASIGLGRGARFATAAAEGSRLDHEGELVALSAFPGEEHRTRVRRPSARR